MYYAGANDTANKVSGVYIVHFKEGKVKSVLYGSTSDQISHPWMHGYLTIGSPYHAVVEKLGQPSATSLHKNGLEQMVSFAKYRTFYTFERAKVTDFGVYDPSTGPMEFLKNQSSPTPK